MPLESIGSYRLIELLGAGAMGEVYKAADGKMFDRVVALKLLSEKFARNENARSRFQNEVQYVAHLDHPNIVKIYDHGEVDGRPYFVMEFLDGIDLARFMKDEPGRNVERCVEIGRQLCEALDFAHRHNVVHRDVKPANVMIVHRSGSEQVKLVDFGIIHVDSSKMTRDGTQPGTSAYSSPEQLRNDPLDHRSDLFSLGIVLYELFANVYPFDAPSEALITHHILQREPESPRKKNASIPAAIDVLILKLLEKDPAQRPQTAGEVAESLRQQLRKLQSRWASTDPAEYENLDEITREAVDKLVAWARQKEADGQFPAAVDAYEKALKLAPESDRIQRRIPKLKHRIESDRMLKEHLAKAVEALAAGRFPDARDHWKNAWILSPESEDVAALSLRIESAEKAVPDDRERKKFVEALVAQAEEALDAGRLDDARTEVVKILQRYPKDPLANFMLERILGIAIPGADYAAYRKAIHEARDFIDEGRFADARARCAAAAALWPGDEEAAGVERELAQRVDGEVAALATRVEASLLRADEPELDEKQALELLAAARHDVSKARAMGGTAAWIAASSEDANRIERAIAERVARAEAFRREQEEQRVKRVDMFLQRGRNQMTEADGIAGLVTTEPAPAVESYGIARESFDRVLQDDATHAEALEARRRIDEQLRNLAARVERERDKEREKALAKEREVDAALEMARAAVAETEIAGSGRSGDLVTLTALLNEADVALDRVLAIDPRHGDAVPLRTRVTALRANLGKEQERRDAQAAAAQREAERAAAAEREAQQAREREAQEAERVRADEQRRQDEEARRKADEERRRAEDERRKADEERKAAEAAEKKRVDEERRAAELAERERKAAKRTAAPPPPPPPPPPEPKEPADPRKIAEFEKGLAKYRRLVQQGKAREASDIQRILQTEAAADPQLGSMYASEFPEAKSGSSRRGLVWGAVAAVGVIAVVGVWFAMKGAGTPSAAPVETASIQREVPPEPFTTAKPSEPPPAVHETAPETTPPATAPAPAQAEPERREPAHPDPLPPAKPAATPAQGPKTVEAPAAKTTPKPAPATVVPPKSAPAAAPAPAQAAPAAADRGGHIHACLLTAAGAPAGAGYRIGFEINGAGRETGVTDAGGCANLDFDLDESARFAPTYAKGPRGEQVEIVQPQARKIYQGIPQSAQVRIK